MAESIPWKVTRAGKSAFLVPTILFAVGLGLLFLVARSDPTCAPTPCCSTGPNGTTCCASGHAVCGPTTDGSVLIISSLVSIAPAYAFYRSRRYRPME